MIFSGYYLKLGHTPKGQIIRHSGLPPAVFLQTEPVCCLAHQKPEQRPFWALDSVKIGHCPLISI